MSANLEQLASRLAISPASGAILRVALTHRSALNEDPTAPESNERLEFLGDAVIELAVSEYLYQSQPGRAEGQLTTLRAAVVRKETLASVAQELDLGAHVRLSQGEAAAGGRARPSLLASTLEAVVGAIYVAHGWEAARSLVVRWLAPRVAEVLAEDAEAPGKDAKSRLQELAQATVGDAPEYRVVAASGPDHAKQFEVEVRIGDEVAAGGIGPSKQQAEQAAAGQALAKWSGEPDQAADSPASR